MLSGRRRLAAKEVGARLAAGEQLLLQVAGAVEKALDQRGGDAGYVAELLGEVEHERVGGIGCKREIAFGRRPLGVRLIFIFDRDRLLRDGLVAL